MSVSERPRAGWRARVPAIFTGVLTVTAFLCAVAAVSEVFEYRSQPVRQVIDVLLLPAKANLGYAALVGVLAASLHRRKRVAYWLLVIFFGLQVCYDAAFLPFLLLKHPDRWVHHLPRSWTSGLMSANLVITLGVLVVLYLSRREFYARVQHGSLPKALGALGGLLVVFAGLGWALVGSFPGSLHSGRDQFTYAVERILGGAFTFDYTRHGHAAGWVNFLLGMSGGIALFVALAVLFRSQRLSARLAPAEEERVRALLAEHGERDSLGYFATRRDKAVIFSPSGKAAVTYRVVAGVCLASGDPLGAPHAWEPAIAAWLKQAREYAWTPAVMGASEQGATAFARAGLHAIELGDEAVVHVEQFTLDGREMRPVRQAARRVERAGYTVRIRRHSEISPDEMARIAELAGEWRDTQTERGFSMALGRLGDPADGQCVLVEAHDTQGRESALLSFAPWGASGLSLDLMRRDGASDNGLIEFMVTALVREAPRLGVRRISLNFAVFRSVFEQGARIGAGPVLRAWRGLLLFLNRWFQLESLYRSNVKFRPEWVPRYLCFDDVRDLAKVAVASGIAEGFVVVPSLPTLLRRGVTAPPIEVPPPVPTLPVAKVIPAASLHASVDELPEPVYAQPPEVETMPADTAEPYPPVVARAHTCAEVRAAHPDLAPDTRTGEQVSVAGRVVVLRNHGSLCFATLRDPTGDLQVIVSRDGVGEQSLATWKSTVEVDARVSINGEVVTSRRGELSVQASRWELAPVLDPRARQALRVRGTVLHALRTVLAGEGFLEMQTPAPQYSAGEPYLRWLVAGGMAKVYELGRVPGDEGVDAAIGPEATMLAAYHAGGDLTAMRGLARSLILAAASAVHGRPVTQRPDGEERDLSSDSPVLSLDEAVSTALDEPQLDEELVVLGARLGATHVELIEPAGPCDESSPNSPHAAVLRLGVDQLVSLLLTGGSAALSWSFPLEGQCGGTPAGRPGSPASGARASRQ